MEFLPQLIASHAGFAYLSLILLLVRGVLSMKGVDWRQYIVLRIAPHLVDSLLLLSGLTVFSALMSSKIYEIREMGWLIPKLICLVLYIVFSAKAFKKSKPFSMLFFILALASFLGAMFIAVHH